MSHRARNLRRTALVAGLAILTVACTPSRPAPTPSASVPELTFTQIDTSAWQETGRRATSLAAVATEGGRDRLTAAAVGEPQAPHRLTVWNSRPGVLAPSPTVIEIVDGDVRSVAADANPALTALAGTTWVDGQVRSYLVTSADRRDWTALPVPEEVDAARVAQVAVAGDATVVVAGNGVTGRHPAVSTLDVAAGTWEHVTLPGAGDDAQLTVTAVAARSDTVVVIAAAGPRGALSGPVAFVSTDRGHTFDGPVDVAPAGGWVVGAIATADGFLVSGSALEDGVRRPRVWHSDDARTWLTEPVPMVVDGWTAFDGDDASFSAPVRQGDAVALAAQSSNVRGVVYQVRDGSGGWLDAPVADWQIAAVGVDVLAVPDTDGRTVLIAASKGRVEERWSRDRGYTWDQAALVDGYVPRAVAVLSESGDGADVTLDRNVLTIVPDVGWSRHGDISLARVTADGVVSGAWGPDVPPGTSAVDTASDGDGTDVAAMTTSMTDAGTTGFPLQVLRSTDGGEWTATTGADGGGFRMVTHLAHLDSEWVLTTQEAADGDSATARTAAVWTSPDGAAWERSTQGLVADGARDSWISDVCRFDGDLVAVGTSWTDDGLEVASWWRRGTDGAWAGGTLDEAGASFSACAAEDQDGEDSLAITGWLRGASTTWRTADLRSFDPVESLDVGSWRGGSVEVDDLRVAPGTVDTAEYTGPVLWVSADGEDWEEVPIPVGAEPSGSPSVAKLGEDWLVTVDMDYGVEAWVVSAS